MKMKGVIEGNALGVVDKDTILAGNDLLKFAKDVPTAISEIRKAITQRLISQEEIDWRIRKILAIKQLVGLDKYKPVSPENIINDLNSPVAVLLNKKLVEASLTVLKNENDILPVRNLEGLKVASVSFGARKKTPFQETLSPYTRVEHFWLPLNASKEEVMNIKEKIEEFDLIIGGIHDESK